MIFIARGDKLVSNNRKKTLTNIPLRRQTDKEKKMHDGCSGDFGNGKQVADKVRMMGFDGMRIPVPFEISCTNCRGTFEMETMVSACPACGMVYAVTPCHANSAGHAMPAGIGY